MNNSSHSALSPSPRNGGSTSDATSMHRTQRSAEAGLNSSTRQGSNGQASNGGHSGEGSSSRAEPSRESAQSPSTNPSHTTVPNSSSTTQVRAGRKKNKNNQGNSVIRRNLSSDERSGRR